MAQRITIIRLRQPPSHEVNARLQWLGTSLGLFGDRDKDRSCFRLFVEILNSSRRNEGLTSDELAYRLRLSRATVIHHLHKLLDSGIVVHEQSRYLLRDRRLQDVLGDMQRDAERLYADLRAVAAEIDQRLGL